MNLKVIFQVGDVDILAILAKNPIKFCLQAMDILFTRDEMAHGRYKAVRQREKISLFHRLIQRE